MSETTECDGCLGAGEHTTATVTAEIEDEGNGWQTWHYCEECAKALGISEGDEISLEQQMNEDDDEHQSRAIDY